MGSDDKSRFETENSLADELYNIGGRIMLAAIAVLFMVVLFILGLHIYARFIWPRYSGRNRRRIRLSRRRRLAFAESEDPFRQRDGLELSVIEAFPVFVYRTETHKDEIFECAVCLCEFGDNEKGRLLPKCNHSFHIECIDMWFGSNSTCPLCRSDARPDPPVESQECPVLIGEIENPAGEEHGPAVSVTGSSSSVTESNINGCSVLRPDSNFVEESSSPKFVGSVVVEIEPRRLDGISSPRSFMADDQQSVSSGVDSSLKSPASRLQSLRRKILGMSVLQSPDGSSHIEQGGPAKV